MNHFKRLKLSEWAKIQGIHYQTAFRWFKAGKLPVPHEVTPTGSIFVLMDPEPTNPPTPFTTAVIYCRVSNQSRKEELEYQVKRCQDFCATNGLVITHIYKEVASGMNDNRKAFWKMLDSNPTTIVIENKDRLTRFGFNYISRLLEKLGTKVIVINSCTSDKDDLIRDLVAVMTSFCCRLYGMRRAKNKLKQIKEAVSD